VADSSILWGASPDGILTKLPTREGHIDYGRMVDSLEMVSGLVLGIVGSDTAIPAPLLNLASKVIETGAAAAIEQEDFPEQSTNAASLGRVLWDRYAQLLKSLRDAVEALGDEPNIMQTPAFNFPPPMFLNYDE
jgi:hypothetical protein